MLLRILLIMTTAILLNACSAPNKEASAIEPAKEMTADIKHPPIFHKPNEQSSIDSFDFSQPFAIKVVALGCGIGCPIYKLNINGDFSAEYEGIAFVKEKGKKEFLLRSASRESLRNFLNSDTFKKVQLPQKQCKHIRTDAVKYQISLAQEKKRFQSVLEDGCSSEALKQLEKELDDIVGRWKGKYYRAVK